MLNWREVDGSWFGNGFRIERLSPRTWRLEEVARSDRVSIALVDGVSADLPTLQAAKFEAERHHSDRALTRTRERLAIVAGCSGALAILGANPVLLVLSGVVGGAALLELAMTWFEGRVGGAEQIVQ